MRSAPFYLDAGYAVLGLGLAVLVVRDTGEQVRHGLQAHGHGVVEALRSWEISSRTSSTEPRLFAACQAGLANNLKNGMVWGCFRCSSPATASGSAS